MWGDALHYPEMRHEIAEAVADPVGFLDHDGRRIVVGSVLERSIFEAREDVVDEFWTFESLGRSELVADPDFPRELIEPEIARRALARLDVDAAVVPPSFSVLAADHLRAHGVTLTVDPHGWPRRRRRKSPWELEGIERAQRAADTAMLTAARMLREAQPTPDGRLRFEGEILTAELVREAMVADLLSQGGECEQVLVHSGDACLTGHELGRGPILPHTSCIIDCFPRERRSGVYTDMTRTFVPGGDPSEELVVLHRAVREALDVALESLRPGRADAFERVAELFESRGWPTQRTHAGDEPLQEGFLHGLGHGVGLQVHEPPALGRRSEELAAGDVVAVEPGLYFPGVGGVRLEDTVLITDDGPEHLTDPLPYDLDP
jgi:Xaa-Pro aminopeptidase